MGSRNVRFRLGDAPGRRLDKAVAENVPEQSGLSRSRIASLIRSGMLRREDGTVLDNPSAAAPAGVELTLDVPELVEINAEPQAIPLDIIFEDDALVVVDKPAGMVVHPAPGSPDGTLVNALIHHCGESLSGIGGALRPGIVHRIDKDTSGLLVVAKSDLAHQGLTAQFAAHTVRRRYDAICWGQVSTNNARIMGLRGVRSESGGILVIDKPIGRDRSDRMRMAVRPDGKRAVTRVQVIDRLAGGASHVICRLETGRTHQIRVHMANIGCPLVGDPVYGKNRTAPAELRTLPEVMGFNRQALHAAELGIEHPISRETMTFSRGMPDDMAALLDVLRKL